MFNFDFSNLTWERTFLGLAKDFDQFQKNANEAGIDIDFSRKIPTGITFPVGVLYISKHWLTDSDFLTVIGEDGVLFDSIEDLKNIKVI